MKFFSRYLIKTLKITCELSEPRTICKRRIPETTTAAKTRQKMMVTNDLALIAIGFINTLNNINFVGSVRRGEERCE